MHFAFTSLFAVLLVVVVVVVVAASAAAETTTRAAAPTTTSAAGNTNASSSAQQQRQHLYVAAVPKDRTTCTNFGKQLQQDERFGELSRFLPATGRVRNGIYKASPASVNAAPVFINMELVNITSSLLTESRGAHSLAASLALTFHDVPDDEEVDGDGGTGSGSAGSGSAGSNAAAPPPGAPTSGPGSANFTEQIFDPAYWAEQMPAILVRRQPFGINADDDDTNRLPIVPPDVFIRGLVKGAGLKLHSEAADASIQTLVVHLSSGRIPVVLLSGCRYMLEDNVTELQKNVSSRGLRAWPVVWGDRFEKYAAVIGVDLELVYVVMPSLVPDSAIAMKRAEFLERWHHAAFAAVKTTVMVKNPRTGAMEPQEVEAEEFFPVQRWVAAMFRPVVGGANGTLDTSALVPGALELLTRPPQVTDYDEVCR